MHIMQLLKVNGATIYCVLNRVFEVIFTDDVGQQSRKEKRRDKQRIKNW